MGLEPAEKRTLLQAAERAIEAGLRGELWEPAPPAAGPLAEPGACFATLKREGRLRGCIGSLEPWRPLLLDAAANAAAAAFEDPRFRPLSPEEREGLEIHLSVLGPRSPIYVEGEPELLASLRPGRDGLVLSLGKRRATFLPAVWEELPEPADFLRHLKSKAGLDPTFWSKDLRFERYEVEEFP